MKRQKQDSHEQQDSAARTEQSVPREFATTDELLRHDAAQITVPPEVAQRLNQSISSLPKPATSWWRRLLGD
jgi:hypothetical protein